MDTIIDSSDKSSETDAFASDDARWAAVCARAGAADGAFFYSVRTTGVYCRPSCPSRTPRRGNVAFHASRGDAEAAGFRPCLRCRPTEAPLAERQAQAVARACRLIDAAVDNGADEPDLDTLAEAGGMSRFHFHRVFKAQTGITPKAYVNARRAGRLRQALAQAGSVTAAAYDAGFNSSGRFYAASSGVLGMTPRRYRAGGSGEAIRFAVAACSLGALLVAATGKGICAILLGDDPEPLVRDLQERFPRAKLVGAEAEFERTVAQVVALVEAPRLGLDLPLDVRGTAFQQRVWQALRQIPAGRTVSYAELAERLGMPQGARAVAGACAANPAAIAIPCHRVVRLDGALSGYRWGIERKRTLLARESLENSGSEHNRD
ncbi:bifunctional DNA-binding transcriptional regulator/O6-methylguanine-DNA methyltransferase Ada [Massilia forsythiae]|uniref:methylated-DNA--[protein]-cysteine S-methyltransferase n=1 Tax=Massilia forsythiae TaxID=2728020 RepID=A0A7Z2W1S1_9BURK|nr:bifunctional DNA-binding transcriptional regulator/O6-methylguanine-DNA methyltransferase Ada [Massilia forsythiae]QJE03304.1 bifunctional DNA-binding transcriptional regulator/O6-methylguanine-DNA methyltransferase Ada [Massilia forsythiae]